MRVDFNCVCVHYKLFLLVHVRRSDTDLPATTSAAFDLIFPNDMFSCDYGTLALWNGDDETDFLASITIDLSTAFVSVCMYRFSTDSSH